MTGPAGEVATFEQAILPHLDAAYRISRAGWCASRPRPRNVVQDAVLRALQYFASFRGEDARAWLLRIVRNTAYSTLKTRRAGAEVSLDSGTDDADSEGVGMDVPDPGPDPEAMLAQRQDLARLDAALAALPVELRECLVLCGAGAAFLPRTSPGSRKSRSVSGHVKTMARAPGADAASGRKEFAMTTDGCAEDGISCCRRIATESWDVTGTALLAAHLAQCPDCAAEQKAIANLSARLRAELPRHVAPARLRQAIEAAIVASGAIPAPAPVPPSRTAARPPWFQLGGRWMDRALPFGAGAGVAIAAALVLVMVLPRGGEMTDSVLASHIRALQPGHLMDVVSTDQHTVKPWFNGRLDYSPPVKNLASQGFPLIGGRLDYLAGRPVAALAYRRAQHIIDLYVWPSSRRIDAPPGNGERSGYNYIRWTQDEMVFWAMSDLNKKA